MNLLPRLLPVALAATLLPAAALAAEPGHDHRHGAVAPATAAASPAMSTDAAAPVADDPAAALLLRMQQVHESLAAARTAGERRKRLAESRQLMQEAMALLDAAHDSHRQMMDKDAAGGEDMDMERMDMGNRDAAPSAGTGPGSQPGMAGNGAPDVRKPMGGMDMKMCREMHAARARHMELMHAVLQALVDQQAAGVPSK